MGISHSWNGTILTITSDSGTSSADLKGEMGIRGPQGPAGTGTGGEGGTVNVDLTNYYTKPETDLAISNAIDAMPEIVGIEGVTTNVSMDIDGTKSYTYYFAFTDGTTSQFTVTDGKPGLDGVDGTNGSSVYLWESKNLMGTDDSGLERYSINGVIIPEGRNIKNGDILIDTESKVYLVTTYYLLGFTPVYQFSIAAEGGSSSTAPNPYPLTFTGAVSGSYDGSKAVTINIPVSSGSSSSGTVENPIPAYVEEEAKRVMKLVQTRQNANTLTFIACSDIHLPVQTHSYYTNVKNSFINAAEAMKLIKKGIYTDFSFCGGDQIWDNGESTETALESMRYVHNVLSDAFNVNQFWATGNHDNAYSSNVNLTDSQIFSNVGIWNKGAVYNEKDRVKGYCYKDFDDTKIRVICINTGTGYNNVSTEQNTWLVNALKVPEGWASIILSHCPLDWNGGTATGNTNVMQTIKAASGVLCTFHGHTHAYNCGTLTGTDIPRIAIPNICFKRNNEYGESGNSFGDATTTGKTLNSATETAFSVITIDRELGKLYVDYYGARPVDSKVIDLPTTSSGTEVVNLVPTSEEANSTSPYNGTGYKNGVYLSSEGGEGTDTAFVATGYIPYSWTAGNALYIRGAKVTTASHIRIYGYYNKGETPSSSAMCNGANLDTYFTIEYPEGESANYYKLITKTTKAINYLRLSLEGTGENLVVTVNQPIV